MVVVDLLDVPLIAGGLDRAYAHLLLVVVIVALLLDVELQLATLAREVRRGLDDLFRGRGGSPLGLSRFSRGSLPGELGLLRQRGFFGFLLTFIVTHQYPGFLNPISQNRDFRIDFSTEN